MKHFYFDAEDKQSVFMDLTGSDFPDERCAIDDAHDAARELAGEQLRFNLAPRGRVIIVRSECGVVLERISIDEHLWGWIRARSPEGD